MVHLILVQYWVYADEHKQYVIYDPPDGYCLYSCICPADVIQYCLAI